MLVNLEASGGGSLTVQLHDAASTNNEHPLLTSTPLVLNGIDLVVYWGATQSHVGNATAVAPFSGLPVRLVMTMQDCNIYGFQFTGLPSESAPPLTRMKNDDADVDVRLWPMPQQYAPSGASLTFDPQTLNVSQNGNSQILHRGIERFKKTLLPPPSAPLAAGAKGTTQPAAAVPEPELLELQIVVQSPNNESLGVGVDESYTLTVQAPVATLHAATIFGALYGLETFSQLVNANGQEWSQPYGICWTGNRTVVGGTVRDWPRFGWRGLLLETGSHFYPIPLLQRMIDAMAVSDTLPSRCALRTLDCALSLPQANKLNALHWSLYDVGSIPLKLHSLPLLSRAAYAPEATYSHADIAGLQEYAKDRGVRIVPNYPQPAHLNSFCDALGLCAGSEGRGGLLDPSNPEALPTFQKLFAESAEIFDDGFVHIYDDEAHYLYNEWNESARVRSFMAKYSITTFPALETWLEKRMTQLVLDTGKTPIVWESHTNFLAGGKYLPCHGQVVCDSPGWMTATFDSTKVVATAYIEPGSLWFLLDQGFQTLFATDRWYLDYDSGSQETTPWEFYQIEPLGTTNSSDQFFINATAEQRILGGHVSMWAQNTDEHNLESRVWPAASAIAERLWSAKNNTITDVKHIPSELKLRLSSQACRMQQRGIRSGPYLDGYCCPRSA
jgi:hexosaminidase